MFQLSQRVLAEGRQKEAAPLLRRVLLLRPDFLPALCAALHCFRSVGLGYEAVELEKRISKLLENRPDVEIVQQLEGKTVAEVRKSLIRGDVQ